MTEDEFEKARLPLLETAEQIAADRIRRAYLEGYRDGARLGLGDTEAMARSYVNSRAYEHATETADGLIHLRPPLE